MKYLIILFTLLYVTVFYIFLGNFLGVDYFSKISNTLYTSKLFSYNKSFLRKDNNIFVISLPLHSAVLYPTKYKKLINYLLRKSDYLFMDEPYYYFAKNVLYKNDKLPVKIIPVNNDSIEKYFGLSWDVVCRNVSDIKKNLISLPAWIDLKNKKCIPFPYLLYFLSYYDDKYKVEPYFSWDKIIIKWKYVDFSIPLVEDKLFVPYIVNSLSNYDSLNGNTYKIVYITTSKTWVPFLNYYLSISNNIFVHSLTFKVIKWFVVFILFISLLLVIHRYFFVLIILDFWLVLAVIVSAYFLYYYELIVFNFIHLEIIFFAKLLLDTILFILYLIWKKYWLSQLFENYVDKELLNQKDKWLKKILSRNRIFIMFSDIESFTFLTDQISLSKFHLFLEEYFSFLSSIIVKKNGVVNKYIWDSILAYWPVKTADSIFDFYLEYKKGLEKFYSKLKILNIPFYNKVKTRFGLHYGEVVLWDLDIKLAKKEYTLFGEDVNLASRLEGLNKYYGTYFIFSESVEAKISNKSKYLYRVIDRVVVKWLSNPIYVYEFIWLKEDFTKEYISYIRMVETIIHMYINGKFDLAITEIERLLNTKYWQEDTVIKVIYDRCKFLLNNKKNWFRYWKYTSK